MFEIYLHALKNIEINEFYTFGNIHGTSKRLKIYTLHSIPYMVQTKFYSTTWQLRLLTIWRLLFTVLVWRVMLFFSARSLSTVKEKYLDFKTTKLNVITPQKNTLYYLTIQLSSFHIQRFVGLLFFEGFFWFMPNL